MLNREGSSIILVLAGQKETVGLAAVNIVMLDGDLTIDADGISCHRSFNK